MRRVTFGVGTSLDHFIARSDHSTDWLLWNDEVASVSADYWATIDTVVMGRKTYQVALKNGRTSYPGVENIVFTRTMKEAPDDRVQIVAEDAADFISRLKTQNGKGICVMGGGELARSLFDADLIDEIGLNVHPILLGNGIPLFLPMSRPIEAQLLESRPFSNDCVFLRYEVRHAQRK